MAEKFTTIDAYIASFPADIAEILQKVRASIRSSVPDAEERVRYDMPAIMLGGRYAIHFAGWKKHVGIYPVARGDEALEAELAPYRAAKDSLNFRYDRPIPYDLIERVAAFLYERHRER